jgi:P2X purinoceptor 4
VLLLRIHQGLGLLGLATVVADLLVTKCIRNSTFYFERKYEIVEEDGMYCVRMDGPAVGGWWTTRGPG